MSRPAHVIAAEIAANSLRRHELETELAHALAQTSAAPTPCPASAPAEYLTTKEAAALLGVSAGHLKAMRAEGRGPRYTRLGRAVRYARADLGYPHNVESVSFPAL